ncbi:hypothetical protein P5W99_10955 [Paraburkholderia sp. A3BS-1L]|uniref:hypothetical protein n=1 Tax=Paraburkholderia sp. A3BS-1L TaxID=3028375 RepID=UPI003DA88795
MPTSEMRLPSRKQAIEAFLGVYLEDAPRFLSTLEQEFLAALAEAMNALNTPRLEVVFSVSNCRIREGSMATYYRAQRDGDFEKTLGDAIAYWLKLAVSREEALGEPSVSAIPKPSHATVAVNFVVDLF